MPGGMPRVKKVRLNSTDPLMVVPDAEKDDDKLLLCQLLEARPDIIPLREGKYN